MTISFDKWGKKEAKNPETNKQAEILFKIKIM